jgi:RNA polymerase primary sigma factor
LPAQKSAEEHVSMEMPARKSTARVKQVAQSSTPVQPAKVVLPAKPAVLRSRTEEPRAAARSRTEDARASTVLRSRSEAPRASNQVAKVVKAKLAAKESAKLAVAPSATPSTDATVVAPAAVEEEASEPSAEPSSEDLEEVEKETAKAITDLERTDRSMLGRYFREMANHRVLAPDEELEAARRIHQLEVGFWRALFSHVPAFETVTRVLESHLEEVPADVAALTASLRKSAKGYKKALLKKEQAQWDQLCEPLAVRMRELDADRIFVAESQKAVERLAGTHTSERDMVVGEFVVTSAFKKYLADVRLAQRAQQEAKNRFVTANLRLVVSIARRYNHGRMPLIDLIQEGNFGLLKGVERFDHTRGYRFSTYASWWIRHAINRALADKARVVRVPVHMLDTYQRVARVARAIEAQTGREATPEEIEKETGVSADKLKQLQQSTPVAPFSLDRNVGDEDGRRFIDFIPAEDTPSPHEDLETKTWSEQLQQLMKTLTPMEARIVRWRFGLDNEDELTLKEIGDKYNLSRERIRQLQEQALGKMRRHVQV